MTFGTEKLEWCGYPVVKKIEDVFIRDERHARTDRQTPHNFGRDRPYHRQTQR